MKRSQVSLYIVFIIIAVSIMLIAGIFAPFGVMFVGESYAAGEAILNQTDFSGIQDAGVRNALEDSIQEMRDSTVDNVTIISGIHRYAWAILLVISALVVLLAARQLSEQGRIT